MTVTRHIDGFDLTVTVHPIETRDKVAALIVDYTATPGGAWPDSSLNLASYLAANPAKPGSTGIRLLNLGDRKVYPVGSTGTDVKGSGRTGLTVYQDRPAQSLTLFAAPTGDSIDVLFPYLGLVQNVPLVRASTGFEAAIAKLKGPPEDRPIIPLDVYTTSMDDAASTSVTDQNVTVQLDSDVLFATDSFTLSDTAITLTDQTATNIAAAASDGDVHVVGHTDDVASDEYNLDLSIKRADAVAERLRTQLGGDFTVTAEGRGKREPIAEGHSREARAANRRVEITFTGSAEIMVGTTPEVPATTDPVIGPDQTTDISPSGQGVWRVGVESVRRTNGVLVGTLRIESNGSPVAASGLFGVVLGRWSDSSRGYHPWCLPFGTSNVSIVAGATRVHPFDYVIATNDSAVSRQYLGDQWLNAGPHAGNTAYATVLWPDPGGDTVTIDVPGRFRAVDIPVEEG